jgi:polysaccharide export outer membrane protein
MVKIKDCVMRKAWYYLLMSLILYFLGSIILFYPKGFAEEKEREIYSLSEGGISFEKKEDQSKRTPKNYPGLLNQIDQSDLYLIGPEDILNISIWKNEDLNHQVIVRPDGKISFPLIGEVQASGRTPEELRQEIVKKLEIFVPNPTVTVMVNKINSIKIYVIGNVLRPGEFVLGRNINVLQALSKAGGFTDFASPDDIFIIRTIDKRQVKIPFNYKKITKGKDTQQNISLQSGDVIVVP